MKFIDYSSKMPHLNFEYNTTIRPTGDSLPDPQKDPVIPGKRVPIRKVGISPVDLPIVVKRRDGNTQILQTEASLYCSLDNPNAKGLNMSRLYAIMHDKIKDHLTIDGMMDALADLAEQQNSSRSYCKLKFKYPWFQQALRSDARGHIAYNVEIEGRYSVDDIDRDTSGYSFFLTVEYVYSSTCPCSFELAQDAMEKRNAAANAHSQRSRLKITVEFDPKNIIWIEDLVELCRVNIPTEVQVFVKRIDEQAFAELNGSNLMFSEDVCRIMYGALDEWYDEKKISDFLIVVSHEESLHPFNAIAVTSKFDPTQYGSSTSLQ